MMIEDLNDLFTADIVRKFRLDARDYTLTNFINSGIINLAILVVLLRLLVI